MSTSHTAKQRVIGGHAKAGSFSPTGTPPGRRWQAPSAFSTPSRLSGQAAVEVLSYASFFLLAFVVTMAVFFQMQSLELSRAEHSFAQEISFEFADHIHTAFVAGPGFVQNVTIPKDLLGKPYTMAVSRKLTSAAASGPETGFVYVEWMGPSQNSSFSAPTITTAYDVQTYSGFIEVNPETGFITIDPKGYPIGTPVIRMENINGTIKLSKG